MLKVISQIHLPLRRMIYWLSLVMQAVSLVASYLQVPLRYPLRFGGSHSYILDNAPSLEATSSDLSSNAEVSTNGKQAEFPLFLDGQDTTRAAYAVFLLNKVCFLLLGMHELLHRIFCSSLSCQFWLYETSLFLCFPSS